MKRILVSLVSEQTIPNVEFIREIGENADQFMFISTEDMEKLGNRLWILNTANLDESKVFDPLIVKAFSFEDIENKLRTVVNDEDFYYVNLTGGTKVMSLAVYEFFKTVKSEIFYLTGNGQQIKIHPGRRKVVSDLKSRISLKDYLSAYGFSVKAESAPIRAQNSADELLKYFLNDNEQGTDVPAFEALRSKRGKGVKKLDENKTVNDFIQRVGFKPEIPNQLNKYEVRYLSGEWLEEYLFYFLKYNLKIPDSDIGMGLLTIKNDAPNEFDVLLMKKNRIFVFECKTSIYISSDESQTFIGETIYKSDSLRNKFGLFAQTIVVTLSDLTGGKLTDHLKRAEASKVKLIGRSTFLNNTLLEELGRI